MNPANIVYYVTYFTASAVMVLGIIMVTGWMIPPGTPETMRYMLGGMMIFWGIYRLVMTRMKQQRIANGWGNKERDEDTF